MKRVYSPFVKRYRSQAIRVAIRTPRVRLFTHIPGFSYIRLFGLVFWRDGWRFGVGKEGAN